MDMSRTTKVLGFSVPPGVVKEVEQVAKEERRTKSELFREMFRVYKRYRQQREQDEERWVMNLIREAKEEQKTNPMTPEEIVTELQAFAYEFAKKAKALGITGKDVNRIIHESRKQAGQA
jgi:metal-responsive CopG/Arc/MetJ family transcriptional regulator